MSGVGAYKARSKARRIARFDLIPQYGQRRRCKGDLLWHDNTTGTVAIWFLNGSGEV
jgi:hypothetical protein